MSYAFKIKNKEKDQAHRATHVVAFMKMFLLNNFICYLYANVYFYDHLRK